MPSLISEQTYYEMFCTKKQREFAQSTLPA